MTGSGEEEKWEGERWRRVSGRGNDSDKREEKREVMGKGRTKEGNGVRVIRSDRRDEGTRKKDNEGMKDK